MKAIAITRSAPDNIEFLHETELPQPTATGHDLLIEVKAISVNPVDTKIRTGFTGETPRVLGWDAVGVVTAIREGRIRAGHFRRRRVVRSQRNGRRRLNVVIEP